MTYRWGTLVTMTVAVNAIALAIWIDPPPRLIWNASPSVPIGFYRVRAAGELRVGELAVVAPPEPIARFMAERGYLPIDVPLIKPVAALPGQRVCRIGLAIIIDGKASGQALERDRFDRPLPAWDGCRDLADDELFFMNPARGDSLDGRYFGPLPASTVIGRATPLRTREPVPPVQSAQPKEN